MKAVHEDLIRRRAYQIWEEGGRPAGRDKQHWEQAEMELLDAAPDVAAEVRARPEAKTSHPAEVADGADAAASSAKVATAKADQPRSRPRGEAGRAR